ncbi:response regulator transcription factor [Allorhodopirellula heiligendammensis]|uniref:Transcriptional activator protein CzcR n=1 Tax=Allorhodopirellula heiligendammensis TaxID=2714739 RepID=A0A5C6BV02_9BACT|nr:response regulator transcription factor [Allorhodopirellula heiligendammensis]TWU15477.1 Transcriptional activator protein CzcR [Allorhodopirellula heiligendammensis]
MRLLLIEDDNDLSEVTARALREYEFSVEVAYDGAMGVHKAQNEEYDLIMLDLMLPIMGGTDVLRTLRETMPTPVLILTARDATESKIEGLNLGADDYLTKPFDLDELIARVRALIRRSASKPAPVIQIGDIEVNSVSREVYKQGMLVPLTAKEYAILHLLLIRRGELVTRGMIYDRVYGEQDNTLSNVVDVYIANLRKRLGSNLIETRRGEGYIIRAV